MVGGDGVENTSRTALARVSATALDRKKRQAIYLGQCVRNLISFCYVAGIEGCVVILLYNVENRDGVTALEELFDYVSADETAATEDDIDLALLA